MTQSAFRPFAGLLLDPGPSAAAPPVHEVVRQLRRPRNRQGNVRLEVATGAWPCRTRELLKDPAQVPGFHTKQPLEQGLASFAGRREQVEALQAAVAYELTPTSDALPDSSIFLLLLTLLMLSHQKYDDADIVDTSAVTPPLACHPPKPLALAGGRSARPSRRRCSHLSPQRKLSASPGLY